MAASWQRIEELFNAAAELPRAEQAAFLDQACGGDPDLRREVESLLAHDDPGDPVIASAVAAAANPHRLPLGRMVGSYRITGVLGEGGMGVVYRAWDTELDRTVALKLLTPDRLGDSDRKRRFIQEAKAASSLNHPHIVTIHTITREGDSECIVMEYVAGTTLAEAIPEKGLPLMDALRLGCEIADALSAAHAAGIVHRDLKPSNIMVTESGRAKVLDFGLAKSMEPAGSAKSLPSTEAGRVFGTPAYMSPEQAQGRKVDARSDIFSFGCVLYEMILGRRAFEGESSISTLAAVLAKEPAPMDGAPPALERLISRCLRKDPADRIASIGEVKAGMQELLATTASGGMAPALAARPRARLRTAAWAAALLAALGAGGFGVYRMVSSRAAPPMSISPLVTDPRGAHYPAFSPDGRTVAFSLGGTITVKIIGAGEPVRLTKGWGERRPVWSPDGRFIAFLRHNGTHVDDVVVIPAVGGSERILAQATAEGQTGLSQLAWTPDGDWLVVNDRDRDEGPHRLSLVSLETGAKRRLSSPPATAFCDTLASLSPDGRTLLFMRCLDVKVCDLYVWRLGPGYLPVGKEKRLTFDNLQMSGAVWSPDGRRILFVSPRGGAVSLWRVAAEGSGAPEQIAIAAQVSGQLAISPQGGRLVFSQTSWTRDLWRIRIPPDGAQAGPAESFLPSTRRESAPLFSPEGGSVVFSSNRSGQTEIWTCDQHGENPRQLTFLGQGAASPRWSPDGARIAFDARSEDNIDVFVIAANGGKPRRLTANPAQDRVPSWSHDGRWIYFSSNRGGRDEIWKKPAEGGDERQVTSGGGFAAQESTDGKFLHYVKGATDSGLWQVPVGGGEQSQVVKSVSLWRNFQVVDDGVYFVPRHLEDLTIQFHRFKDGKTQFFTRLDRYPYGFTISPDRGVVLLAFTKTGGNELMLVENFR